MKTNAMPPVARRSMLALLIGMTSIVALHSLNQPIWVSGGFLFLAIWRCMNLWRGWPLPDRSHRLLWVLKHLLALSTFVVVYRSYGGVIGRDAGIAMLILLIGLKLVELRTPREFLLTAFLGFFLLITTFFYSQNLPIALAALACTVLLLVSLHNYALPADQPSLRAQALLVGQLLLHATPLMVIAFVLFPRPASPLWQLPKDARGAVSGLSEEMSPGQLSELSLSDAIAFRVAFSGNGPPASEMYWRGPVLVSTDGTTWRPESAGDAPAPAITAKGPRYSYSITMEPSDKPWIYALEHPSALPRYGRLSRDLRIVTSRPVTERVRYAAESYTQVAVTEANWEELRAARYLPAGVHPRTVMLGQQWREELRSDDAIVGRALEMFRDQPFYYTLTPPEAVGDSVDAFMFDTRRGFCEHYAAAFTVLMRGAKIPARVVTGYQGGEYNPVGDYYIVRQRDAHAWAEVWLGRKGWIRVDPTAAIPPSRVQRGLNQALRARELDAASRGTTLDTAAMLWGRVRFAYDALNNRWNIWVIGYNTRRQQELLDRVGLDFERRTMVMAMMATLAITFAAITALAMRAARGRFDPVRAAYQQFCRKLGRRGVVRAEQEGPVDYARRAALAQPAIARQIEAITDMYVQIRYGPGAPDGLQAAFYAAVRRFAP